MTIMRKRVFHKGFTLIELLIVILIVSMVYILGFHGVELNKNTPKTLTPLNLKENIINSKWFNGHATLICVNKCHSCYLRDDISTPFQKYTNAINLKHIQAYTLDNNNNLMRIEYERFHDKKICLKMDFYNNGSSTQLILKQDKDIYFLPAYFDKAKHFTSIDDAKEYWLRYTRVLSDSGDYY
jgi:prepilin-type N-terminal cleavage/methylation domain-containing protein